MTETKNKPVEFKVLRFFTSHVPRLPQICRIATLLGRIYVRKPRPVLECDVYGFKMVLSPHECVDRALMFAPHLYDWREIEYMKSNLPQDGVFIDAGANVGFYTLMASRMVPNGKVYAIEAVSKTYSRLENHVKENQLANVITIHVGLSDCNEVLPLSQQRESLQGNSGGNSFVYSGGGAVEYIQCSPLLDIVRKYELNKISALKIDTEGFENKILRRYFADGGPVPDFVIIEQHPWDVEKFGDIVGFLCEVGYAVVFKTRSNNYLLRYGVR